MKEELRGRLQIETVASQVLKGNPLGDPSVRRVPVYLPPSYGRRPGARYPVIYFLPGFTGGGRSATGYSHWKENIVERLDRLIAARRAPECLLVVPDAFTAYGGSQYLDSPATGRYESHMLELVAFIDDKFGTAGSGRAVMGGSSGGFGALWLSMRHPKLFPHCAAHSADMLFEHCYGPDFLKFAAALHRWGGDPERLRRAFLSAPDKSAFDHALVNTLAMAACYSGGWLPFDPRTAELVPKVWAQWKEKDPVSAAARHRPALKKLKTLFFDAGRRDEFFLQLGARKLADELRRLGVAHAYEEHEFGHFDRGPRYDRGLTVLGKALRR